MLPMTRAVAIHAPRAGLREADPAADAVSAGGALIGSIFAITHDRRPPATIAAVHGQDLRGRTLQCDTPRATIRGSGARHFRAADSSALRHRSRNSIPAARVRTC